MERKDIIEMINAYNTLCKHTGEEPIIISDANRSEIKSSDGVPVETLHGLQYKFDSDAAAVLRELGFKHVLTTTLVKDGIVANIKNGCINIAGMD